MNQSNHINQKNHSSDNIPALRFPEFGGEWEKKTLSHLAKILYGKDQKQVIDENGKHPILGTGGIIGRTNQFLYDKPSVLIGRKGTIDRPVYMDTPFWTVDTLFYTEVFANTFPKWLYYKFQTINWYLYNEASGVPSLSGSTIYKIKIKIPCIAEQSKIAIFLSAVENKLTQLKQKKSLLEQYKKGVMQKIFSQEIRFKDNNGKEFPEWEIKKLGEVAEIKGGKRVPKGYSLEEKNNGFPYITVSDMENGTISLSKIRYVPLSVVETIKNYKISTNDIYISVAGTLGLVGIIPKDLENANLTENANKITNLKCDQQYLLQYLKTDRLMKLVENVSTIGAQPKLAIYAINAFSVPLPSLLEQTKIANFLFAFDVKIDHCNTQIKKTEQWKRGLLQKMFC